MKKAFVCFVTNAFCCMIELPNSFLLFQQQLRNLRKVAVVYFVFGRKLGRLVVIGQVCFYPQAVDFCVFRAVYVS